MSREPAKQQANPRAVMPHLQRANPSPAVPVGRILQNSLLTAALIQEMVC